MTTATFPPYGRLVTKLTAIGPYLRQEQTSTALFFFDCLASCINANKDPEKREFWGWWMELTPTERGFSYRYFFGRYDVNGDWSEDKLPAKHKDAVMETLNDFYPKLCQFVIDESELELIPSKDLSEPQLER